MTEAIDQHHNTPIRKQRRSFTLIEILIAAALFTGIVVLSVGAFTDSISFNSGANDERAVRQSSRTLIDFLTLQLRSSASKPVLFVGGDYALADGTTSNNTSPYVGTGYLLINGFNASSHMQLTDLQNLGGTATAIIIPTAADSLGNIWLYIGTPDPTSGVVGSPGIWKATINAGNSTQIPPVGNKWTSAGDLLPNNVLVGSLAFRGISPQGTTYTPNGSVASYSVPAQPYVTIQMSTAPTSNASNVMAFETSITSRDYSFAFPQCSNTANDPNQGCQ